MSIKQARLIAAVRDAQEAQGVTGKELAVAAGTSQGTISTALGGKAGMSEQKWRMVCERLGLDYDEVVADPEEPTAQEPAAQEHLPLILPVPVAARQTEQEPTEPVNASKPSEVSPEEAPEDDPADEDVRRRCEVLARYLAKNIKRDLEGGTDMSLEDIWTLLDTMRLLQNGGAYA